jgi:glycogenin glucosyltransferase
VYDYNSLVDRWFAVYDRHYRAAPPTPSPLNFEVARYDSVWDEGTSLGAEVVPSASLPAAVGSGWAASMGSARLQSLPGVGGYPTQVQANGPLSLDDLRRMAVEGVDGVFFFGSGSRRLEGEYRRLPLDGRIDLMRPKHVHIAEELDDGQRTPQQHSFPSHDGSQAGTPPISHEARHGHRRRPRAREHRTNQESSDSSDGIWLDQPPFPGHRRTRSSPPRPQSPPKISWNPATDPPPNVRPPPSAFPTETYFPNAWDRPEGRASDVMYPAFKLEGEPSTEPFFHAPPLAAIPETLIQQGAYDNVVHGERLPHPDPAKVKAVFPWEEQPRHAPTRAFPKSESPPRDTIYLADDQVLSSAPPAPLSISRPVMHKSLSSSLNNPNKLSFTNAWDSVPSIKKYAKKLAQPEHASVPRVPSFDDHEYQRQRELHERLDAISREADDEDEGDDEDEEDYERRRRNRSRSTEAGPADHDEREDDTHVPASMRTGTKSRRPSAVRIRSGSGSPITSPFIVKKEYASQAVQTISIPLMEQHVQVSAGVQVSSPPAHASPTLPSPGRHVPGRTQSMSTTRPPSDIRRVSFSNRLPTSRQGSSEDVRGRTESLPMRRDRTPLSLSRLAPAGSIVSPAHLRSETRKPSSGHASPLSQSSPSSSSETPARRSQLRTITPEVTNVSVGLGLGMPNALSFPQRIEREVSGGSIETGSTSPLRTPITPSGDFDPVGLAPGHKVGRKWNPNTGVDVFKRGNEEVLARFLRKSSWEEEAVSPGGSSPTSNR